MNTPILMTLNLLEDSILLNEGVLTALDRPRQIQILINNDEKMLPGSKETLDLFYQDSIKRLEEFCGKTLEGIWY